MKIEIQPDRIWYHGSNKIFSELRTNSTITQWKELAEAFSHQPSGLWYDDNGMIGHNGTEKGYLYIMDEPLTIGVDIYLLQLQLVHQLCTNILFLFRCD